MELSRRDFSYWQTFDVRARDMDARGHVNNADYFTYFENARRAWFHEQPLFDAYEQRGQGPVLATQACTYLRQLRYPQRLDIGMRVTETRTRSWRFDYGLFLHGEDTVAAHGHTVHAWIDQASEKAIAIPEDIARLLEGVRGSA
ncbi:MAG: thioesterase family protein [Candidatus Hydrogenedentota bacterium]